MESLGMKCPEEMRKRKRSMKKGNAEEEEELRGEDGAREDVVEKVQEKVGEQVDETEKNEEEGMKAMRHAKRTRKNKQPDANVNGKGKGKEKEKYTDKVEGKGDKELRRRSSLEALQAMNNAMVGGSERMRLRVGGKLFETFDSTLHSASDTLLGKLKRMRDDELPQSVSKNSDGEFHIDRDGEYFRWILNWHRTKVLVCPPPLDIHKMREEMEFFGVPNDALIANYSPEKRVYLATVLIQANRYDMCSMLHYALYPSRHSAFLNAKKLFFTSLCDHWHDRKPPGFTEDNFESLSWEFYENLYSVGDDPAKCATPGGPYQLRVFEYARQESSEEGRGNKNEEVVETMVDGLPKGIVKKVTRAVDEDGYDGKQTENEGIEAQPISGSGMVKLNVGGKVFEIDSGILTRFPTTMLGAMFGGDLAKCDDNGHYFLDRDGELFEWIMKWYVHNSQVPDGSIAQPLNEAYPEDVTRLLINEEIDFFSLPHNAFKEDLVVRKVWIAALCLQGNGEDVRTWLYSMAFFGSKVQAIEGGRKFFFDKMQLFWGEYLSKRFTLEDIEKFSESFYEGLYRKNEEARGCMNPGGPYTLRVFEFTLPADADVSDGVYQKELVYGLPRSVIVADKRFEADDDEDQEEEEGEEEDEEDQGEDEDEDEDEEGAIVLGPADELAKYYRDDELERRKRVSAEEDGDDEDNQDNNVDDSDV